MKKEVCIASTLVFPSGIELNKQNNLINQIHMMLTFLGHYQKDIHIVIVSNKVKLIEKILKKININLDNYEILEIKKEELIFCNQLENEYFRYAFSKLDALPLIKKFFSNNKKYKKLIISDIDCIFLSIDKIISFSKNIKTLAAINYRNEHPINSKFDKLMTNCIRAYWPDFTPDQKFAWISSGFIIIDHKIISTIIKSSRSIFNWIQKNKNFVKSSCSQYGDEIIFSAIFNKFKGKELDDYSSKVARILWTCYTASSTPFFVNPFNYPSHIHLPASKFSHLEYQMHLISKLGSVKKLNFLILLLINYWSMKNRLLAYLLKFVNQLKKNIPSL